MSCVGGRCRRANLVVVGVGALLLQQVAGALAGAALPCFPNLARTYVQASWQRAKIGNVDQRDGNDITDVWTTTKRTRCRRVSTSTQGRVPASRQLLHCDFASSSPLVGTWRNSKGKLLAAAGRPDWSKRVIPRASDSPKSFMLGRFVDGITKYLETTSQSSQALQATASSATAKFHHPK